jgi:hypothetical protein
MEGGENSMVLNLEGKYNHGQQMNVGKGTEE